MVPFMAVGSTTVQEDVIPPPLHRAGCSTHCHHVTWADDLVLLDTSAQTLQMMIDELLLTLNAAGLNKVEEKARYWSLYRSCSIIVSE